MEYVYRPRGTCSSEIRLNIEGDVVTDVKFKGGCPGNLTAIPILVEGMTVTEIEQKLSAVKCGFKNTSCAAELAKAARAAYEAQNK